MSDETCVSERICATVFEGMHKDLRSLDSRVGRLEAVLARGLLLLIANLLGVIGTLISGML